MEAAGSSQIIGAYIPNYTTASHLILILTAVKISNVTILKSIDDF
jgi:hypothetical protein